MLWAVLFWAFVRAEDACNFTQGSNVWNLISISEDGPLSLNMPSNSKIFLQICQALTICDPGEACGCYPAGQAVCLRHGENSWTSYGLASSQTYRLVDSKLELLYSTGQACGSSNESRSAAVRCECKLDASPELVQAEADGCLAQLTVRAGACCSRPNAGLIAAAVLLPLLAVTAALVAAVYWLRCRRHGWKEIRLKEEAEEEERADEQRTDLGSLFLSLASLCEQARASRLAAAAALSPRALVLLASPRDSFHPAELRAVDAWRQGGAAEAAAQRVSLSPDEPLWLVCEAAVRAGSRVQPYRLASAVLLVNPALLAQHASLKLLLPPSERASRLLFHRPHRPAPPTDGFTAAACESGWLGRGLYFSAVFEDVLVKAATELWLVTETATGRLRARLAVAKAETLPTLQLWDEAGGSLSHDYNLTPQSRLALDEGSKRVLLDGHPVAEVAGALRLDKGVELLLCEVLLGSQPARPARRSEAEPCVPSASCGGPAGERPHLAHQSGPDCCVPVRQVAAASPLRASVRARDLALEWQALPRFLVTALPDLDPSQT